MGRELRRVPADWQHPQDENGNFVPLHGGSFAERLAEYKEEACEWALGRQRQYCSDEKAEKYVERDASTEGMTYVEWVGGPPPEADDYMPDWPEEERTHFQMYETCSEGTPISPVFATIEELARWLADNGASAFASETATYEQWLATCKRGFAFTAVFDPGKGMQSGVAFMGDSERTEES